MPGDETVTLHAGAVALLQSVSEKMLVRTRVPVGWMEVLHGKDRFQALQCVSPALHSYLVLVCIPPNTCFVLDCNTHSPVV